MSERKRFLLLIIIMATASAIVAGITMSMLYRTAFNEEKARLVETAQSQARLIEAVARFDAAHEITDPGFSSGKFLRRTDSRNIKERVKRMKENKMKFTLSLEFEDVSLPPFKDILILGRGCPHGKRGIAQCFNLLAPDSFDLIVLKDEAVQAMLGSKSLL